MPTPLVVGYTEETITTNETSHPLLLPPHVEGDKFQLGVIVKSATHASVSGWSVLTETVFDNKAVRIFTFTAAGDSESATILIPATKFSYQIVSLRGAGSIEAGPFSAKAYSNKPDPPALTTSWGDADNLAIAFAFTYYRYVSGGPSGWTNFDQTGGHAIQNNMGSARLATGDGTIDPGTFTLNASRNNIAITTAVQPAAAESGENCSPYCSPIFTELGHEGAFA